MFLKIRAAAADFPVAVASWLGQAFIFKTTFFARAVFLVTFRFLSVFGFGAWFFFAHVTYLRQNKAEEKHRTMEKPVKEILGPYRAKINALDEEIIDLLRRRYDVIEEVGPLKAREGIASVLPDRVDEVCDRATALAAEKGLDAPFIRKLYEQLVEHSCNLEEEIIQAAKVKKAS